MTQEEIKEAIDTNNKLIESYLDPTSFVLDPRINELMVKNQDLQGQCQHEFDENGVCKYCYFQK